MSNHTEQIEQAAGGTTSTFTTVWVALLAITGIEIFLAYEQLAPLIMLTLLMGLSVIKAALIIAYFMHLKFERFSLFLTLFPMLVVCILLLFIFMPDAIRLLQHRVQ
jgi:cytochrome c oxidase subunit 4